MARISFGFSFFLVSSFVKRSKRGVWEMFFSGFGFSIVNWMFGMRKYLVLYGRLVGVAFGQW